MQCHSVTYSKLTVVFISKVRWRSMLSAVRAPLLTLYAISVRQMTVFIVYYSLKFIGCLPVQGKFVWKFSFLAIKETWMSNHTECLQLIVQTLIVETVDCSDADC